MPEPIKGAMYQFMTPVVDATDGLSIESTITESDFQSGATLKFFGVNHGVSTAFTSGTISKAGRLVHSGIFQITLKGTENNYDKMLVLITKTGIAPQILTWNNKEVDPSDIYSLLSDFLSDFQSRVPKRVATDSQLSAAWSDIISDLGSQIGGVTATLSVSDISDIASRVWSEKYGAHSLASSFGSLFSVLATNAAQGNSRILLVQSNVSAVSALVSDVYSLVSDLQSDFQSRVPKRVATDSQLSDAWSDIISALGGITATLSVSDISDIASRVWSEKYGAHSLASSFGSLFSVLATNAAQANSRALLTRSDVSDLVSRVPKEVASKSLLSDVRSDLGSQIGGITATLSVSDISDIASRVWSEKYAAHSLASSFGSLFSVLATNAAQGNSRALIIQSNVSGVSVLVSDVYSLLSDLQSDFQSRVPKRVATDSQLSDAWSDIISAVGGITATLSVSDISDIASRVWSEKYAAHSLASSFGSLFSVLATTANQANSRALQTRSDVSDLVSRVPKEVASKSLLSDVRSDLASQIAGIGTTALTVSDISDIASRVWSEKYAAHSLASSFGSLFSVLATNAAQGNSRALVIQSAVSAVSALVSDVYSLVSDLQSDFQSRVPKRVATDSQLSDVWSDLTSQIANIGTTALTASDISDIASRVWSEKYGAHSLASSFGSLFSVLATNAAQANSRALLTRSDVSDLVSRVPKEVASKSLLSDVRSDLGSQIGGITATLSVSDISDIASRVWSEKYAAHSIASSFGSLFSVLATTANQANSRALQTRSDVSDLVSRVPKEVASKSLLSDVRSDLASQIAGIGTTALTVSDISDIASRVWSEKYAAHSLASSFGSLFSLLATNAAQGNSRALVIQSNVSAVSALVSDVYSLVSDLQSDFQSRVPKRVATDSQLSDVWSDLTSQIANIGTTALTVSDISDIASRVWSEKYGAHSLASSFGSLFSVLATNAAQANSRALLTRSDVSDLVSRVPKEVASKSLLSDVRSDLASQIAGIGTTALTVSDISDIASRVWSEKYAAHSLASSFGSLFSLLATNAAQGNSRALVIQSNVSAVSALVSDVYSLVSDLQSDFQSRVPKRVATDSQLSNAWSDIVSAIGGIAVPSASQVADAVWDEVLTLATHNVANSAGRRLRALQESGGVYGGYVWIDTVNGTAGTSTYENGTSDNPVDNISDANTLAASLGISRFMVAPGSTITFAATHQNQEFCGEGWTLALGGQNIAGTTIRGAVVSGTGTGSGARFYECDLGTVTLADCLAGWCRLSGTVTFSATGNYYFHDCYSAVAGAGTPTIDFGAAVANTNLSMRRYSGGLTINNKDATGTDNFTLEGQGQLLVAASSSGAISVRGSFKVTNTGGATITYDDNTSRILVVQSLVSDVDSLLSDLQSDFQSRVPKRVATDSQLSDAWSDIISALGGITATLSVSDISDIASRVWSEKYGAHSLASSFGSLFSVLATNVGQANSRALQTRSDVSDLVSRIPKEVASKSLLSDVRSDLGSQIAGIGTALTASDISDIASRVWAEHYAAHSLASSFGSLFSTLATNAAQANSRALVVQSSVSSVSAVVSDVYSLLSDLRSDFQSRVPKRVATDSQLSDLHSDLTSQIAGLSATLSDVYSSLSNLDSDFQSRVPKRVATDSQLSDVQSDLQSRIAAAGMDAAGSDPVSEPGPTASTRAKLDWVAALALNEVQQSATVQRLRNSGDTSTVASAAVADSGGSYVRGQWG